MPGVVVADLDGTLLDQDAMLRPRSRDAIGALLDRGVPVVFATARPQRGVRARIDPGLLERVSLVQMNGAALRSVDGSRAAFPHLSPEVGTHVLRIVAEVAPTARIVCEMEGDVFGCDTLFDADTLWVTNSATPDMVIPFEEALERGGAKIAVNGLGQPLAEVASRLREACGEAIEVIEEGSGTFLNIVPSGVSKPAALRRLLGDHPWPGMLAFGDDIADLEMLSAAEHGVAMANAHPRVLDATRYRTWSNAEDGVARILELLIARFG